MPAAHLDSLQSHYDVVVIGSGLAGMTGANRLARLGHRVLLLEHHSQLGGLATSFRRPGGHIFDVSLHGFPQGMVKSCRKYWSPAVAASIRQIHDIRFDNPDFKLQTTFDRADFTRLLTEHFRAPAEHVAAFFAHLRDMNYYDRDTRTIRDLFDEFFPARPDIHRLLLEPIAYANGSTLDDPAIAYGIVFSNFMNAGVFTFQGGTDVFIGRLTDELRASGVEIGRRCLVEKILFESGPDGRPQARGVRVKSLRDGGERDIACGAVFSNAGVKNTVLRLAGEANVPAAFAADAHAVRVNNSSAQVYIGVRAGESLPRSGDLLFTSEASPFSSDELVDFHTTSRTFSIYYPETRPQLAAPRYAVVASLNQRWEDWAALDDADYARHKARLVEEALSGLEKHIPGSRAKTDWAEAATPRTVGRYTRHWEGTSFGTKFEGLRVSLELPEHVPGLFHAGSVGIIMSGWLGALNYGVIVAAKTDAYLRSSASGAV
ncbi:MAG: FAD-dependent oxidoreductase [Puniceicoccales bacterium]|nr:FAD-dependent oxidoreductase [Puniceicoccales bacterium]